jgi:pantothenate kinase
VEQLSVEVHFEGEQVGSHTEKDTTYTLYNVGGDLYMVHVDAGDEKWLETNGGQGLSEGMIWTFFPLLAEACGVEQVFPHKFGSNGARAKHARHR